ncbi:hypothetical protein V8E53_004056 [Lactarius tabidus]
MRRRGACPGRRWVAMQGIGLEDLEEEEFAQLMREVDLVKQLSHPGIVPDTRAPADTPRMVLSDRLRHSEN